MSRVPPPDHSAIAISWFLHARCFAVKSSLRVPPQVGGCHQTASHAQRLTHWTEDQSESQTISDLRKVVWSAKTLAHFVRQLRISGLLEDRPSFLRLPHEIRDHIYGYILTLDRGPECEHPADSWPTGGEILGLLGVNRQVRDEARGVLERSNVWIRFTTDLLYCQSSKWKKAVRSHARYGCTTQPYPLRGGTGPLQSLKDRSALAITIRPSSHVSMPAKGRNYRKPTNTTVFAYSQHFFGCFCVFLLANARLFQNIGIEFNPDLTASGRSIATEMTESLRVLRDYRTVAICGLRPKIEYRKLRRTTKRVIWYQWQIIALVASLKQQGNKAFHAHDYPLAIHFYKIGIAVWITMIQQAKTSSLPIVESGASVLENLYIVLNTNLVLNTNRLAASRREEGSNRIIGFCAEQLDDAIEAAVKAATGPSSFGIAEFGTQGPTSEQQVKAAWHGAIALVNKADFQEQMNGKFCIGARVSLCAATQAYEAASDSSNDSQFRRKIKLEVQKVNQRLSLFPNSEDVTSDSLVIFANHLIR